MTCPRRKLLNLVYGGLTLILVFLSLACRADVVTLRLRNGDRITGAIIYDTTNEVTIFTAWAKELVIPASQIEARELVTNAPVLNAPATNPPSPTPPVLATKTNGPPVVAKALPAIKPASPLDIVPPPPPPLLPWYDHWKGEILVGTTLIRGATDTELYYGKATFTYSQAYLSDPKEFFRNIFSYVADYGKTAGVVSANDMSGSSKTDIDLSPRTYVYNLGEAGYDEIRSINLHYEDGPGGGYHLFKQKNFIVNAELGANYQVDEQAGGTTIRSVYYRLAEDLSWKINPQMTLTEKYEFFPRVDLQQYRWRFESTLSYAFLQNLSFNLAVVDFYDTAPASGVPNNDFEFRTSLGVKF